MADLSPSAQAVFDAAFKAYWNWDEDVPANSHTIAAAALRAAADQLFPKPDDWDNDNMSEQGLWLLRLKCDQLLAIAAELEAQ
jgi:hypothetical protein